MRQLVIAIIFTFLTLSSSIFAEETKENSLAMTTNAFLNQGMLPVLYTCDGKNLSPQLDWSNAPAKTKHFAIVMADPDAPNGTFYHWILFNIPKSTSTLQQGISKLPSGTLVGKNSFGKTQYDGPCPPHNTSHTYAITLYALDDKLSLPQGSDAKSILDAIKKHTVSKTELTAVYSRWFN